MMGSERITRVAPFGVRPVDPVTAGPVGVGLTVAVRRPGGPPDVRAVRTPSGLYALWGLPGLGASERGTGDAAFWAAPPATGTYRVEIRDPAGGFLPTSFEAALPFRGLFDAACGFTSSPPWEPGPGPVAAAVPLFSSPSRPVPAGAAAVRAQLRLASGEPAAWALLEAALPDGATALGLADGAGRVAVLFAYPEPPGLDFSSPPGGTALTRLSDQTWQLGLRAYFGRGTPPAPVAAPEDVPDLCDLLDQRPVGLLADDATALTTVQLAYGRELVVRTAGHSTLLLAGSS